MAAKVVQQAISACKRLRCGVRARLLLCISPVRESLRRRVRMRELALHADGRVWTIRLQPKAQIAGCASALVALGGMVVGTIYYTQYDGKQLERQLAAAVDLAEARAVAAEAGRAALRRDLAMTEVEALRLVREALRLEEMAQGLATWLALQDQSTGGDTAQPSMPDALVAVEWGRETTLADALAEGQGELASRIAGLEAELREADRKRGEHVAGFAATEAGKHQGADRGVGDGGGGDPLDVAVAEALHALRHAAVLPLRSGVERDRYLGGLDLSTLGSRELNLAGPVPAGSEADVVPLRPNSLYEMVWATPDARRSADSVVQELAGGRAILTAELARLDAERAGLTARLGQLRGTMDRLQDSLTLQRVEAQQLAAVRRALARERDEIASERDRAESRAQMLDRFLVQLANDQVGMVDRVVREMDARIGEAEQTIALTGLTAEQLLEASGENGQGGPFIPMTPDVELSGHPLSGSLVALTTRIERWDELRAVMARLPFAAPMDAFLITSQFGRRTDPLNSRAAFHAGVDFIGPTGARIYAPAPGVVVYAGRRGGYGRVVDIDHGKGIITRYAHLASIDVQLGDKIGYRDEIGVMGSSGRVTGAHLHYEVRVDGKPIDPMNFIRAGRRAYQTFD